MQGFPDDLDVSAFVGRRLDSVTFAEFIAVLDFERGASVTILGHSSLWNARDAWIASECEGRHAGLLELIGHTCSALHIPDKRTMRIEFDTGQVLVLQDDDHYESVHIRCGGREYIV